MHRLALVFCVLAFTAAPAANSQELPVAPMPPTSGFMPLSNVVDSRFSGDGTVLWATSWVQLKAWDVASGRLLHDEGTSYQRTWSEAGTAINIQFNGSIGKNGPRYLPAVSNDGKLVAIIDTDANLKPTAMLWDVEARTMRHIGTFKEITGFAPDSSRMVVVGHDGKVEVREPVSGNLDRILFSDDKAYAALPGDGKYLSVWAGKKSLIYTWPWSKPEKNKGNDKRRFNFLLGEYLDSTVSQNMLATNADRSLRLRRAAWQQERPQVWRNTYQVERADGSVVSTYISDESCFSNACAIVGDTGLWAMRIGDRVRLISIDSGEVVREYPLIEDKAAFSRLISAQLQQARNDQSASAATAANALADRIENRPVDYQKFLVNFEQLPTSWVLDYNTLRGREITHYDWVSRSFGSFFGGESFNALGKVADCANGSVALLTLTRSQRNGADSSLFQLAVFDVDGKLLGNQEIGQTQKDSSGRPLVVAFALNANATQARIDIRQSRWDGDKTRTLTLDKTSCSVR